MARLSANYFENLVKVKVDKTRKRFIDRNFDSMKTNLKSIAKRWKQQARKFLSKPSSPLLNKTKYPRKLTGKLRNSVYYGIRSYKGTYSFSFRVAYGFHEVYAKKKSKHCPDAAYGKCLNEWKGKTFAGYRERINERMKTRIETFIDKKRRLKSFQ